MSEDLTLDEYRTGYIAERHGVSDNCARALQLFEIGYSVSGAAQILPVSESTVKNYHRQLQTEIGEKAVYTLSSYPATHLDVFPPRSPNGDPYTYEAGRKLAKSRNERDRKESAWLTRVKGKS